MKYFRCGDPRDAGRHSGRTASAPWQIGTWKRFASSSIVLLCFACESGPPAPVLDLPARPSDAPHGTEIIRDLRSLDLEAREERIYAEISRGNVPSWLRQLRPVEITGNVDGRRHCITFWATPDYLAVGSESDFVLVPLSARTAQRVADLVDGSLPTPRMVDAIWASARVQLMPIRFPPDEFITTVGYIERHDRLVRAQRVLHRVAGGVFVAGHKLDVVLSSASALSSNPGAASIYGWHRHAGDPIQPLYTDLQDNQVFYSFGLRLVHRRILVNGIRRDLQEVPRDPKLAPLLSGGA